MKTAQLVILVASCVADEESFGHYKEPVTEISVKQANTPTSRFIMLGCGGHHIMEIVNDWELGEGVEMGIAARVRLMMAQLHATATWQAKSRDVPLAVGARVRYARPRYGDAPECYGRIMACYPLVTKPWCVQWEGTGPFNEGKFVAYGSYVAGDLEGVPE